MPIKLYSLKTRPRNFESIESSWKMHSAILATLIVKMEPKFVLYLYLKVDECKITENNTIICYWLPPWLRG